ncbi:MAG: isoleucine--tRNA ligase [Candidatus Omnitrophica bacterium]|nr:isoleucine--tRNA ligase [Candidatus Omnitrophota bacterium]
MSAKPSPPPGKSQEYRSTLNLPKTAFAMKADLPQQEPQRLAWWKAQGLYARLQQRPASRGVFVLHDGPPYANGDIHIGHALNKTLKDIIVRYKTMQGFRAPYVPGWDCHGMPIEHQLFKELRKTKHDVDKIAFRKQAQAYAQQYVTIQGDQFQRLGVLGDWEHPYLTMTKEYEATIVRVFHELLQQDYIYRGQKPVAWCATCETALAEAELEYETKASPSIYVEFPIIKPGGGPGVREGDGIVIWTTTPWTLPANQAVCFHPKATYVVVTVEQGGRTRRLVVAQAMVERFASAAGLTIKSVDAAPIPGPNLGGAPDEPLSGRRVSVQCQHPLFAEKQSVGVSDEGVSLEEGTGIVHIAPGHGQEDYAIGQRYGLAPYSPVDERGRFTKDVPTWAGISVVTANEQILEALRKAGRLVHAGTIQHSYPHCWRCKQPVIFRATSQWFLNVEQGNLRRHLLERINDVRWIPEYGKSRITGMVASRPDWCLSRQRYWGTPIPIVTCSTCKQPLKNPEALQHIQALIRQHGSDIWFTKPVEELLPPETHCGTSTCVASTFVKEEDILDVWFDSGVSHEAVVRQRAELSNRWPVDLYLEGSDQHRGWFQVSLITSVALRRQAPFQAVLTHGFVVDGDGKKMSKSAGNVVAPQEVIAASGADILRLWVASCDYAEDVRLSPQILERIAEGYRKIRNTLRFMLGNLYDFHAADRVPEGRRETLDRWALMRTAALLGEVTGAFEAYQFHRVYRSVYNFCVTDLSSFYLDVLKDRLYTASATSAERRSAQSTLCDILQVITQVTAPIMPFTSEEVWQLLRAQDERLSGSVHESLWPAAEQIGRWTDTELAREWELLLPVREVVMKALEEQRASGTIGTSLEAAVTVTAAQPPLRELLQRYQALLPAMWVVSQVSVEAGAPPGGVAVAATVRRAAGQKCQRCWMWTEDVGRSAQHPTLCQRCVNVILS